MTLPYDKEKRRRERTEWLYQGGPRKVIGFYGVVLFGCMFFFLFTLFQQCRMVGSQIACGPVSLSPSLWNVGTALLAGYLWGWLLWRRIAKLHSQNQPMAGDPPTT
jgi:hypothetical protein